MQLLWFLDSSNPGRHSQATPPLGVSLQIWAQPWSLFMQLMPSAKQDKRKSISVLNISACRPRPNQVSSIHTDNSLPLLRRLYSVRTRSISLQTGKTENPILQSLWPRGFSICTHVLGPQGQKGTSLDLYSTCILIQHLRFTPVFIKPSLFFYKNHVVADTYWDQSLKLLFFHLKERPPDTGMGRLTSTKVTRFSYWPVKQIPKVTACLSSDQVVNRQANCTYAVCQFSYLLTILLSDFFSFQ